MFGKRIQVATVAVGALLLAMIGHLPAHSAAQINGSLSNFDTFNDSGVEAHGFEIELDGIAASDVQYWFGAPYNRYGTPTITDFTNGSVWGAKVRWESPLDANGNYVNTTAMAPANPTPTDGHACYLYGPAGATQQLYDTSGCEHFGLGLINNPTNEVYNWLVDDPSHHGTLVYANTPVSIPAPVWTSSNGNVAAALPAPAPQPVAALPGVPDCALWGDAVWVKVYKTESHNPARLGALLTDSKEVPENSAQVETEWEFLQGRPTCDDTGKPLAVQPANELVHQAAPGAGAESVTRRFEIFKYTGTYDDTDGGNHEALPLCDSNPFKLSCSSAAQATPNSDLGAYVGAQMAAANLMAAGVNTAAVTVSRDGTGTGTVSDNTGGITCGDLCGGSYSTGTVMTLTATPDAGSSVAGWSVPGCGTAKTCTFTVSQDTTVNVTFGTQGAVSQPTISGLSAKTVAEGQTLTIAGTDLATVSGVQIGGVDATVTSASDTSVSVVVPCGATSGVVSITTDGGTATSAKITVKLAKPTISSFTPTSAFASTTVTLKGTYLGCLISVTIGGKAARIGDASYSLTTIAVPANAASGSVVATNAVGSATAKTAFTLLQLPSITSFSPSHVLPGATVTVSGVSLGGATSATINGTTAKAKSSGTTSVTVTVPAGASTGDLVLHLPGGDLTAKTKLTVDVPLATIASVSASSGSVGTSVLVKGTNFTQATQVTIGGHAARVQVISPTVLVFTVSTATSSKTLRIDNGAGVVGWSAGFAVTSGTAVATLTKISAKTPVSGTVVTVTGTNLGNLQSMKVAGVDANFTVLSNTTAAVVMPAGKHTGLITASTVQGAVVTGPSITVLAGDGSPTVTSVSPTSTVNGAWVLVSGANLAAATGITVNGTSATFYVSSATSVYVQVPLGATSGAITVTTPGGTAVSTSLKIN